MFLRSTTSALKNQLQQTESRDEIARVLLFIPSTYGYAHRMAAVKFAAISYAPTHWVSRLNLLVHSREMEGISRCSKHLTRLEARETSHVWVFRS